MTTTANLAVTKIDSGQAQKEVTANEAFDVFDAAATGFAIALSDANYTLSTSTTPQEWQYLVIKFTGALTAGRNIIVPTNKKPYIIVNATTGGFALTVKTSGGSGIAVSASAVTIVYCDGTNVVAVTPGAGSGTVSSVGVSSTDLSVSGSPVTSSGSIMLNINNGVVTYAKMQDVSATSRLLGRVSGGSGDVEEVVLDTDGTMAANSASYVPAQSAVKTFVTDYVASQLDGRTWKQRVRAATTANGTLATAFANGQTIDGVTLATGDRILLKNQTAGSENGIYTVNASGAPTRTSDADTGSELVNATVEVSEGTVNADLQYTCSTNAPITVGSTSLVFVPTSTTNTYTADETTLHLSGSQFSLLSTAPVTHAATSKSTPVDADEIGIVDSAASNVLKKLTWANLKATLKTYFDTLYAPLTQPFDVFGFYPGLPAASGKVFRVPLARAVTFAGNFSGSYFTATANATASTVFDVQKNGSSIGSVTIAAGTTTATFVTTSGTSKSFAAGDVLEVIAPSSPDATLANPGFAFAGTR